MSDTSYLKLIDGPRIKSHMGLQMEEGFKPIFGKNYLHMDIPVLGVYVEPEKGSDSAGSYTTVVKRGQTVFVSAAGTIDVKGRSFIEVEPNRALAEYGQIQPLYRVHPDEGLVPLGFQFTARKDVDLSTLKYAVRLYMPA